MESNVLNHKSEQGKSQTKKKKYICVHVCVEYVWEEPSLFFAVSH